MNPKVSIIVPVYNTEKFLNRCITSALRQSLEDIEIIIINDASTDQSLEIIKEYQILDSRIKLINFEENKGNGYGRNEGIKEATGDYILFLDSDDWLEPTTAEVTYQKAISKNFDTVLFGYTEHYTFLKHKKKNKKLYLPLLEDEATDFYKYFITHRKGLYSMPWVYLLSRKLLIEKNVTFSEGIYFEDIIFVAKALHCTKMIGVINNISLYNYRIRGNSITRTFSKKKIDDCFTAHVYLKEFLQKENILKLYEKEYLIRFMVYCIFPSFSDFYRMKKSDKDRELEEYVKKVENSKLYSPQNIDLLKNYRKECFSNEERCLRIFKTAHLFFLISKYNKFFFFIVMQIEKFRTRILEKSISKSEAGIWEKENQKNRKIMNLISTAKI